MALTDHRNRRITISEDRHWVLTRAFFSTLLVAFRGRQIVGPHGIVAAFPHGPHDLLTKRTAFRKRRIRFVAEAPKPFEDAQHELRRIGLVVVGHA